jgi:hypothetical protein
MPKQVGWKTKAGRRLQITRNKNTKTSSGVEEGALRCPWGSLESTKVSDRVIGYHVHGEIGSVQRSVNFHLFFFPTFASGRDVAQRPHLCIPPPRLPSSLFFLPRPKNCPLTPPQSQATLRSAGFATVVDRV